MAALRKPPSPSKWNERYRDAPSKSKSMDRNLKRARSESIDADEGMRQNNDNTADDDDEEDEPTLLSNGNRQTHGHPVEHQQQMTKQPRLKRAYIEEGKTKRRALIPESSVDEATPTKQECHCKFARAGCPFVGSQEQVKHHEDSYCIPLYTQLAHYKMLAQQLPSTSSSHLPPSTLSSKGTPRRAEPSLSSTAFTPVSQNSRRASVAPTSPTKEQPEPSFEELNAQIQRLQTDLQRAQSQLIEEKNLRTERLRKASERLLDLMNLSEVEGEKVDVLRLKLRAEREVREKLQDELDSLRAASAIQQRIDAHAHQHGNASLP